VVFVEDQSDVTVGDLVEDVDLIQVDDGIGAVRRFEEEKIGQLLAFHRLKYSPRVKMLSMTKQTALDFTDLRYLEITCSNCKARLTVDAGANTQAPASCGGCGLGFDKISVREPIDHFMLAYRILTHREQKFRFRVIVEEPAKD
jgi:hypothetical protein